MTIDAKELREAIDDMGRYINAPPGDYSRFMAKNTMRTVLAAASTYAATLPRETPVDVTLEVCDHKLIVRAWAARDGLPEGTIFYLTGLVTLPPREKD
jgi:hypothetical protein